MGRDLASSAHPQLLIANAAPAGDAVSSSGVPGWFWVALIAALTAGMNLINSFDQWMSRRREALKEKPEPAITYRTNAMCDVLRAQSATEVSGLRKMIEGMEKTLASFDAKLERVGDSITRSYHEIDKADEARSSQLHRRFNALDQRVSRVEQRAGIQPPPQEAHS